MKGRNYAKTIEGKPVVNASRRVTLHVSEREARFGSSKNPADCAAARAAVREVPNCTKARIHLGRAYLYDERQKHWKRFKTTDGLRNEIIAFDKGGKFEPGEYDLRPLSPSDTAPKKRVTNAKRSETNRTANGKSQTKTPRKLHVVKGVRGRA